MLTIDALKDYGANVEEGLARCVNKESLYLRLVKTVPVHEGFNKLYEAIKNHDLEEAFQCAHGLKGAVTNLSLTPLVEPIVKITELLRAKQDIEYTDLLNQIEENRLKLANICAD